MKHKHIIKDNGKKIIIDTNADVCLYWAPRNPPNTGTKYLEGTDLYLHKTKSGAQVFYLVHWSMWQGSETTYRVVSEDEAKEFFETKLSRSGWEYPNQDEIDRAKSLWPDLFEEDA
ncbi:MAG: hypothetical protein QXI43_00155 [Candidatus Nitrosocaldus sp.]